MDKACDETSLSHNVISRVCFDFVFAEHRFIHTDVALRRPVLIEWIDSWEMHRGMAALSFITSIQYDMEETLLNQSLENN